MEYLIGLIAGIVGTGIAARAWLFLGYRYYKRGQRHFEQANEQYAESCKLHHRVEDMYERNMDLCDELICIQGVIETALYNRK